MLNDIRLQQRLHATSALAGHMHTAAAGSLATSAQSMQTTLLFGTAQHVLNGLLSLHLQSGGWPTPWSHHRQEAQAE